MTKGKLIVLDGTDGSGKTEQARRLAERMPKEGHAVKSLSFPRYGKRSAGHISDYLEGLYGTPESVGPKRASILYAVDRWASYRQGDFAPLDAGTHLISNRYVASNMGHQGSKIADARERSEFYLWNDDLEHGLFGIPRPDINIILHVSAATSMRNIDTRGNAKDAHENLEHLRAAEATYLEIARSFPNFALIECEDHEGKMLSKELIHEMVWQKVLPILQCQ